MCHLILNYKSKHQLILQLVQLLILISFLNSNLCVTSIYMMLQNSTFGGLMHYLRDKISKPYLPAMNIGCGYHSYIHDIQRLQSKVHDHLNIVIIMLRNRDLKGQSTRDLKSIGTS